MQSSPIEIMQNRIRLALMALAASSVVWQSPYARAVEPREDVLSTFLLGTTANDDLQPDSQTLQMPVRRKSVGQFSTLVAIDAIDIASDEVDDKSDRESDDSDRDNDDRDQRDRDQDQRDDEDNFSSALRDRRIAQLANGRFDLPELSAPRTATNEVGNGKIPEGSRGANSPPTITLPESGQERNLDANDWPWMVRHWAAANTYSYPRYFEDRMLERHGHERFPVIQPLASGARFFATVPMMPYLMTLSPPCECESTLGYFRSGSCAPVLHQQPPLDSKAIAVEAIAIGAAIAIIP